MIIFNSVDVGLESEICANQQQTVRLINEFVNWTKFDSNAISYKK